VRILGRLQIPTAAEELLTSGRLAHLVTTNADGSPEVSIARAGRRGSADRADQQLA